jgi:LysM repeat protein/predicted esterase
MRVRKSLLLVVALAFLAPAAGTARAANEPPAAAAVPAPKAAIADVPDAGNSGEMTEDEAAPPPEPAATPVVPREPAVKAPQGEPANGARSVTVGKGDTLGGIAHRYGITSGALATANGITRGTPIRVGERLEIPVAGETVHLPTRVHVVAAGNTLGSIAKSYGVSIDALLEANKMKRTDRLKIGQKLVIADEPETTRSAPSRAEERADAENDERSSGPADAGMQELSIPGTAPAYYFEPTGPGRSGMRPVIIYLHGRGAEPGKYCQRWARVARRLGWLVCPSGQEDRGEGKRGWGNSWPAGRRIVMAAIDGLRRKYGRRVQLYGNTLIGFSEGAFVAMNVGLREPHTFNRWLILGADADYWGAVGVASLPEARGHVRRVYLITGKHDEVVGDADEVKKWLEHAGVPVRVLTPRDMGHEVALEAKPAMYQAALRWLAEG